MRCRLRWWLSRQGPAVERSGGTLPQLTGLAVHDAWEKFLQCPPEQRSLDLLRANVVLKWDELQFETAAKGKDTARENSLKMVEQYWAEFGNDAGLDTKQTEQTLSLPFGADSVEARLDKLQGTDIHELKTTGSAPRSPASYLYFNPQIRIQGLLVKELIGWPTAYVTVLWPTGAVRWQREFTEDELDLTKRDLKRALDEIRAGDIYAHESFLCNGCYFENYCIGRLMGGLTTGKESGIVVEPKEGSDD